MGFSFTDNPAQHLNELGFSFHCDESSLASGYKSFLFPFLTGAGIDRSIEIREVLDEEAYFQFQKRRSFSPFESENASGLREWQHPNSAYCIQAVLDNQMQQCELKDYLQIRKKYPLWALWLKCADFELFGSYTKSEKNIIWQNQPAVLIHLGQSCFDLVITK